MAPTGIGVLYGERGGAGRDAAMAGRRQHDRRRHLRNGRCTRGRRTSSRPAPATSQTPSGSGRRCDYVQRLDIERIAALRARAARTTRPHDWLTSRAVRLVGTATEKASVLSFVLAGHEPLEVGKALNAEGIAVRAGHHCAQPILRRFGLEATVRPSFAFYNTFQEIDVFINAVRRIAEGGTNVG